MNLICRHGGPNGRCELCMKETIDTLRTEITDLKSLNATLSKLAEELDKARRERDQCKGYYIHAQDRIDGMSKVLVTAMPGVKYDCEEDLLSDLVRQRDKYLSVIECTNNNTRRALTERDELLKANVGLREALEKLWAAIGDALLSGKGIEKAYAQAVMGEITAALTTPAPEALERLKRAMDLDRLLEELRRDNEAMGKNAEETLYYLSRIESRLCPECKSVGSIPSGVCGCGTPIKEHSMYDGHPVIEIDMPCPTCKEKEDRLRKEAQAEVLERLLMHTQVRLVPACRTRLEPTTESYVRMDVIKAKIAELRGQR